MDVERDLENLNRLKRLLRDALVILPADSSENESSRGKSLFKDICDLVFSDDCFYQRIWGESTLNQLVKLFEFKSPNRDLYREELEKLLERKKLANRINDFFFSVLK